MLTSFRSMLTSRRPMLPKQILTVFMVPCFFHKSSVKSLRSVFRRRETKVERTLYSTITNPEKCSKSLFHRRRPPLLLKESECRSISGIIGSRIVAAPKNNPMTSPPLGRCYLFSTQACLSDRLSRNAQSDWLHRCRLSIVSINLLVFYHECRSLIGYATRYLFCDR